MIFDNECRMADDPEGEARGSCLASFKWRIGIEGSQQNHPRELL
jgi:hypothetical protein